VLWHAARLSLRSGDPFGNIPPLVEPTRRDLRWDRPAWSRAAGAAL